MAPWNHAQEYTRSRLVFQDSENFETSEKSHSKLPDKVLGNDIGSDLFAKSLHEFGHSDDSNKLLILVVKIHSL